MTAIMRITKRGDYSSRLARKILSWNQAFKIVLAFDGTPTVEEIELFLDEQFEFWKAHPTLQREFKSFQDFLLCVSSQTRDSHWLIPNYTTTTLQETMLALCRSWYSIDDIDTQNDIKSLLY
jgi:hypothetical protein